jgi:class 3 adenylate cyclase
MYILDPDLLAYLRHRVGDAPIESRQPRVHRKALELNEPEPNFAATFGDADVTAYVGFIDLAGFSNATSGKSPAEIAAYVVPFLQATIRILRERQALVDKTIGDEIMFVLPETEEEGRFAPEVLFLGQICGALHDLAYQPNSPYQFRLGLSYGKVRATRIAGQGYSEWTFFGEPIHVAKRLHSLPELAAPNPVSGAFGMSVPAGKGDAIFSTLQARLGIVAGFASRFSHQLAPAPVDMKGVGEVWYAIMHPKGHAA